MAGARVWSAVDLRLCEIRRRLTKDHVGPLELAVLPLEFLDPAPEIVTKDSLTVFKQAPPTRAERVRALDCYEFPTRESRAHTGVDITVSPEMNSGVALHVAVA